MTVQYSFDDGWITINELFSTLRAAIEAATCFAAITGATTRVISEQNIVWESVA